MKHDVYFCIMDGRRVFYARRKAHITQADLAKEIETSLTNICRAEKGESVSLSAARSICTVLSLDPGAVISNVRPHKIYRSMDTSACINVMAILAEMKGQNVSYKQMGEALGISKQRIGQILRPPIVKRETAEKIAKFLNINVDDILIKGGIWIEENAEGMG